ncbi:WecB/TagA/CpsF family glycosyltransferase [Microbacterium lacus]|uniref:WecB/TagA/CpsF family glycosyltransferase n=1 Tax=Microbacterium lacus TaxID=415217 RepID=UPI00384F6D3F
MLNRQRRRQGQGRLSSTHRVGSTDWVMQAMELGEVRKVCVLGGRAQSNAAMAARGRAAAPGTEILSIPADPWSDDDFDKVCEQLRDFAPDLLLIGMGMPLQERVSDELAGQLRIPVVALVGGAIDQLSGVQRNAPRWLGRLGGEWLWRLATQPRRLAYRYLVEPFALAKLLRDKRGAA